MKDEGVTLTKAVGIILMVFAHAIDGHMITKPIALFHMPLFFIMSGFCFNDKNLENGKLYLWKKVKGIYLPYVKWCLLFLLMHNLFFHFHFFDTSYTILDYVKQLIKIVFLMRGEDVLLGGYWFLRTLFESLLVFWLIVRYTKGKLLFGVTIGMVVVGVFVS